MLVLEGILFDHDFWFGADPGLEVLDVMLVVEGLYFFGGGLFGVVELEGGGESVVVEEAVDHLAALGLHGVFLAEFVLGDFVVVEVADFRHM